MNHLVIEPMTREHIPAVQAIEMLCFASTWPDDAFQNEVEKNGAACYLVAHRDGQVVGYAGAWLILEEMHVTSVAVHPDFQGQRIGKRLFWHLMEAARERGCRWSTLEVRETNEPAVAIYHDFGFTRVGLRRKYYDGKDDALVMWVGELQSPEYDARMAALRATWEGGAA